MVRTLHLLNEYEIIKSYEIQDYKQGNNFYYIKMQAKLVNNTILFIREYVSEEEYNYSYHWQAEDAQLIIRWDNAPHHKQIKTFPHHKHIAGNVLPSYEIGIREVLAHIDALLKK